MGTALKMFLYVRPGRRAFWSYFEKSVEGAFIVCLLVVYIAMNRNRTAMNSLPYFVGGMVVLVSFAAYFASLRRFRKYVLKMKERDELLPDFENSSERFGGRVRLGETFVFLRKREAVFPCREIRGIGMQWVKAMGYFPEITLRDGSKYILWEDGVGLMTRAEAARHYLPVLREMTKHNPEILRDLADDEERRGTPEANYSEQAETAMRNFLKPGTDFGEMFCIFFVISIFAFFCALCVYISVKSSLIAETFPVFAGFCFLLDECLHQIRSNRDEKADFEKRMRSLEMQDLMDEVTEDFRNSIAKADGGLRFGKKYLFAARAGNICAYADILDITIRKMRKEPKQKLIIKLKGYRYLREGEKAENRLISTVSINTDLRSVIAELEKRNQATLAGASWKCPGCGTLNPNSKGVCKNCGERKPRNMAMK